MVSGTLDPPRFTCKSQRYLTILPRDLTIMTLCRYDYSPSWWQHAMMLLCDIHRVRLRAPLPLSVLPPAVDSVPLSVLPPAVDSVLPSAVE